MMNHIHALIRKDFRIEMRQRYALNSVLLFVFSAVFLTYLSLQGLFEIQVKYLSALFWVIFTFAAVNAVSKSFIQETENRRNYYFTLTSANAVLISKMIYNSVLILLLSFLSFAVFSVFLAFSPGNMGLFISGLILGSLGYASVLTMVSAIAAKTNANFALVSILGFPLILPLLLLLIRITDISIIGGGSDEAIRFILILFMLDIVVWVLSLLLFPYVWRD